jgi:O-antigen biosynthesis protein WbqP
VYVSFGKRWFDVIVATSAAVVLAPLMVVTGIFIKIFDPGPVFFRQIRVGSNGRLFSFYKFRSMPVDTGDIPSDQVGKVELTWVGSLIRRTNIDELPQLFNILIGDMSIVGPRPSLPTQHELIGYRKENGALTCRPGLTGLAQISSFDGMKVIEKANLDGKYARSISFSNDISIILKTFGYLLKPPPVY